MNGTSLNPVDYKIREGHLKMLMSVDFPSGLGFDAAGDVVAVGSGVSRFAPGDRVMTRSRTQGTLAEYCIVDEDVASKIPDKIDYIQAAALPLAGQTALQSLRRAKLAEGESILICGAAGGVGTYIVQLARHVFKAARVVATASPPKFGFVQSLGATECVDYKDKAAIQALGKFDVVFDCAGDAAAVGGLIKPGRLVVSISSAPDADALARAGMPQNFLMRSLLWIGSTKERFAAYQAGGTYEFLWMNPIAADLDFLGDKMAQGLIKSVVDSEFHGLDKTAEAFTKLEKGTASGKIVVLL